MILIWIPGQRIKRKRRRLKKKKGRTQLCLFVCFCNWASKYAPMDSSSRSVADHIVIEKEQTNRAVTESVDTLNYLWW